MASARVKKVIISKTDLPPVGPNNDYLVRYRIVSEDKNRSSHWSHVWRLDAHPAVLVEGSVELRESMITVGWEDAPGYDDKEAYDIFISVDGGDWQLKGSPREHMFTFLRPIINTEIRIVIQVESYLKVYNEDLVIFDETVVV